MKSGQPTARVRALLAPAVVLALGATPAAAGVRDVGPPEPADVSPFFLLQDTQPAQPALAPGQPATEPAGAAADGQQGRTLRVTVRELAGTVTVSNDDGKTWTRAAVDDAFGPGSIFRTGLRSAVTCVVGTDQMFTLESLSTIRVEEAIRTGGREKTGLVMKYGAASYGIEAAGREYDATIRTPGSTMAVRGTVVRVVDRPGFAPQAESYAGRALFRTAKGTTAIGGRGYSVASAVQGSAAETALSNSTIDPSIAAARTASESRVVAEQLSQGGVLGFDARANIPVVRGGGPLADSALPAALPGRLSFALRWGGSADLNFIVDNQAGNSTNIVLNGFRPEEILYPGFGLNVTASGGIIPFDHRGGPGGGTEIAYWENDFPLGVYGVGVLHASGGETDFKVNAFLDNQPLPIFTFDEEGNIVRVNTLRGTVGRNDSDGAILFVPRSTFFEDLSTPGDQDPVTQQATARAVAALRKNASAKPASAKPASAGTAGRLPPRFGKPVPAHAVAGPTLKPAAGASKQVRSAVQAAATPASRKPARAEKANPPATKFGPGVRQK